MSDHPWYSDLLTCPDCGTARAWNTAAACLGCGFVNATPKDWRAVKPLPMKLTAPRVLPEHATEIPGRLEITGPELTYDGPPAKRNSRQFMSIIQDHLHPGDTVLDPGCGPRDQVVPLEHLKLRYVGLDYDHAGAEMWGDAHSLPFKDQSFDCVLSYAVLEHLHAPWVAIHEVARILKPGGIYIGSVSQGEPFHHSYFHHTPWAMCSLIALCPELRLERIWPSMDTLRSLSRMGRYPRVIQKALQLVDALNRRCPWLAPRRMRWSQREKALDHLYRAGSLCFLVRRHQHSVKQNE